ncbi:MAG: hypothetical protein ACT6SF_02860 [Hydrogenophaga sp.]|jgi:hypothetical protein|uniref:hypothetical protein n=1 Tax=Hydrogenophaga sp. TaxID=1904254 RepID=UPI001D2E6E27|nr:hypothetical protein [Hydrogenophaga sp.]MBW0170766.1 hypothetical protein [Hydrogenophaga sp.]MBW0183464.1 hypothetical protein [Hydrogenophaga sp.]
MSTTATRLNPFVLMLDPEAVISAMESSADLRGIRGRICRPLDKPLIPKVYDAAARAFDAVIEAEDFMDTGSELYCQAQPALQAAVH